MKINRLLLVASSFLLLTSCGGHGSDITQAQAEAKAVEAKKKVEDPTFTFPKAFNFTAETSMKGSSGLNTSANVQACFDKDAKQAYVKSVNGSNTSESWVYKDGDKYYTAYRNNNGDAVSAEIEATLIDAKMDALYANVEASFKNFYTSLAEGIAAIGSAIATSYPEGVNVKKNEGKLQSKGDGHLYVKLDLEMETKVLEATISNVTTYELEFENYLPVNEYVKIGMTAATGSSETVVKASFDWTKSNYPGNPKTK